MSSDHPYIPFQDTYKALHTRLVSIGGRDVLIYYSVLSDTDGVALKTIDRKLAIFTIKTGFIIQIDTKIRSYNMEIH